MKKLKSSACFLLTMLLLAAWLYIPDSVPAAEVQVQDNVVRVVCLSKNEKSVVKGAGFAVGKMGEAASLFVTNYHIIAENPDEVSLVLDYLNRDGTVITAEVAYTDPSQDLAILRTESPVKSRTALPLCSAGALQTGQEVYLLGYASNSGRDLPSTPDDVTMDEGVSVGLQKDQNDNVYVVTDAAVTESNTGGPLITGDGYIVGMATNQVTSEQGNAALAIDTVIEVLQNSDIPFDLAGGGGDQGEEPNPNNDPQPTPSSPFGTVPGGTQSQAPASSSGSASVPGKQASDSTMLGGIALIVVGAAVVGVGLFFLLKKRKNASVPAPLPQNPMPPPTPGPNTVPMPVAPPAPAPAPVPRQIQCVGGVLNGQSFPVAGKIAIGRDPARCSIVYPKETPGVSALHCELSNLPSGLVLIDQNSTYGTYLADGTKLIPGQSYPLPPGSEFYLAQRENTFRVL